MPPKKKGNKKAQDDWEADLGESIPPADAAPAEEPKAEEPAAEDDSMGGGLLASLARRKKTKKNKKGGDEDWVQGEDPTADGAADAGLESKAPVEANLDDDDDVFAGNYGKKKGKGADKKEEEPKDGPAEDDGAPRVKTKAEKEKEKKEKEKQRKKELVRLIPSHGLCACVVQHCIQRLG